MLTMLLEPLQFPFMVNAMLVATIVAVPCALLSVFLVLKGWALIGDAMNHAMFPGIVLAWIIGMPLGIGAFIVGLSCAIATGYLKDNSIIKKDTIIGIVFSGIFVLTINRHKSADYRYHYYITVYSAWYRLPFLPH